MKITTYKFSDVDRHIEDVRTKSGTLQNKIHALGIAILAEWARDKKQGAVCADKINALVKASPYHAKAFAVWVNGYTPFQWSEKNKTFFAHVDQGCSKEQLDRARLNPFWEVSPPRPVTLIDDIEMLEKLIEKVSKRMKEQKEGDVIHPEMWRKIRELKNEYAAA